MVRIGAASAPRLAPRSVDPEALDTELLNGAYRLALLVRLPIPERSYFSLAHLRERSGGAGRGTDPAEHEGGSSPRRVLEHRALRLHPGGARLAMSQCAGCPGSLGIRRKLAHLRDGAVARAR